VRAEGFPLGLFPDVTYDEVNLAAEPGDAIVFVSDGILDAENAQGEMYGHDRLAGLLCSVRDQPAAEIADAILAGRRQLPRRPRTGSTTKPSSSSACGKRLRNAVFLDLPL